jgi:hypothetical protein
MKPLFTGKIKLTWHAQDRLRERNVNVGYVKQQLAFIPYQKGIRKWYIPGTDFFVTYNDHSEKNRTIITLGRVDYNWKP